MKYLLLGFILMLGYGCSTVTNMDKLLQVKSLSDNQVMQQKLVEQQNKKFKALLDAVNSGRLQGYPDQQSILKAFGEPIYVQMLQDGGKAKEKWMYRYSEKLMGSEKVYLYFDATGQLIDFKDVKPSKASSQPAKTKEPHNAAAQKT